MLVYHPSMDPEKQHLQDRSRATAERLLSATIRVIDESGLDGATIPRIAAMAKVAPASVYRRYRDKDALIRAAFLHVIEQAHRNNRSQLQAVLLKKTLDATAVQLMRLLFAQYESHPLLFRALSRYADACDDREFVRKAGAMMAANVEQMVDVFLHHRREICHRHSERALRFALLHAICSIEIYALDPNSLWHCFPDLSRDRLIDEIAAGFVAYLRRDRPSGRRRSTTK